MKIKIIASVVVVIAVAGGYVVYSRTSASSGDADTRTSQGGGGNFGGGGFGGPGGGRGGFGGPRLPMTVELASVTRSDMTEQLTVVGNLIGAATVEAVPKVSGRLQDVSVRLGDRVTRGQTLAKIEDSEIEEQVKQAQAAYDVAAATIRQREASLRLAQTNLDRSKNLYDRQLIPKQTFDDTDANYEAAVAQLDLARAQFSQAQARLDELKINLANTTIASPVTGFIGKRALDAGAWVTPNSSFISVVDITTVRLVANVVEKDLRRIAQGQTADVAVDAYPGEKFEGHIAHVAPVLDPATRTAQIEVEIANPGFRLKPGMYAKVSFLVENHPNALVIPTNALVDSNGTPGVYQPDGEGDTATFRPVTVGLRNPNLVEVVAGLNEGERVVTTGAAGLREGDKIVLAAGGTPNGAAAGNPAGGGTPGGGRRGGGRRGGSGGGRSGGSGQ
jgi:membrane fusion protein (multidrug efflux system)